MSDTGLAPGALLKGRYVIEDEFGRGGMAVVYRARDTRDQARVAIKVLFRELSATIGAERFRREIQLASTLSHTNILPIRDYGDADGLMFYVMPLVTGRTLRARLDADRQLPIEEAVRITGQVARALEYAHDHGIVHRDIKPENILLQNGEALVADFGIARALGGRDAEKLTQTGIAIGTPAYMSPEQAAGDTSVDQRSDVYSLGCVAYEMLAGQPPFVGPSAQAIMARHALDHVPSLRIVRDSVPPAMEDVVNRALAKVPADRFQSALDFASALERIDASKPARSPRSRAKLVQRAAVVVIATVAVSLAWRFAQRATAVPDTADADPNHLAVLYFEDRTGDDRLRFLPAGLTEALIGELSQVRPLRVVSANGVAPFRARPSPMDSLRRALHVGSLVTGRVSHENDRVRVRVALVNAVTGDEVASRVVERPRAELFALEDDLAGVVSGFVRARLGEALEMRRRHASTRSSEAWERLQRGNELVHQADALASDVDGARRDFRAADSLYAAAEHADASWAPVPTARAWLAYRNARLHSPSEVAVVTALLDSGVAHANRALRLSGNDQDALEARATLNYWRWLINLAPDPETSRRLMADAERDFRASVAANPQQATAWNSLSHLLLAKSRTSEAKLAAGNAYELDPYLKDVDKTIWRLFQASTDLGNRQEAVKWCNIGMARFPENYRFTECRLWALALLGQRPRVDSIWLLRDSLVVAVPASLKAFTQLKATMIAAISLIRAGLPDSARRVIDRTRGDPEVDPNAEILFLRSIAFAQLRDSDAAVAELTRYLAVNPQYAQVGRTGSYPGGLTTFAKIHGSRR